MTTNPTRLAWIVANDGTPVRAVRDGLRYEYRKEYASVVVYRDADDVYVCTLGNRYCYAILLAEQFDLEAWRTEQLDKAREEIAAALTRHREACERHDWVQRFTP